MKPFDANGAFRPTADGDELVRLAMQGAGVTVLSNGLMLGVQILGTVILARLLTPGDFGVVTMVTTFSLLFMSFGANGFTEAIIQRPEMDRFLASNLFWINTGAGFLLTLGFSGAGSLMARFYGNPHVVSVARGMSLTIFITSTSVLHLALLRRAMRFSVISSLDVLSRASAVGVSILLGLTGWGYWALVAGAVTQSVVQALGAWTLCRWVPDLPRRTDGTAAMVRFAVNVYGRFSLNYFARNLDNVLVGWRFNAQSLGFYKKAYDLFSLSTSQLVTPLTSVAVSALSRFNRDPVRYRQCLLSALGVLAFAGMGLGGYLTLVGKDVIRLLLGPGWEPAGRIFTYFGPGVGMMLIYYIHGWIHLSIGRADRWFRWGVVELSVTGLLFLLAMPAGPEGIAVAWAASFWILTIPAFWYAGQPIHLGIAPVLAAVWKYILASLLAGGVSAAIMRELPAVAAAPTAPGAVIRILTAALSFGSLYLGAVCVLYQGLGPLYRVKDLLSEMVWSGKLSPAFPVPAAVAASAAGTEDAIAFAAEVNSGRRIPDDIHKSQP